MSQKRESMFWFYFIANIGNIIISNTLDINSLVELLCSTFFISRGLPNTFRLCKTGMPLKLYARAIEPVAISRVYAFDFRNGGLNYKTREVRAKLSKDLSVK